MRQVLSIIVLLAFLGAAPVLASRVTDVELSYQEGNTVATIYVDGPIRFTHEAVEAKEGKPFRVLVDVLSATHHLGIKDFSDLPRCIVGSIRTSQYSVEPEKVAVQGRELEPLPVLGVDLLDQGDEVVLVLPSVGFDPVWGEVDGHGVLSRAR